MTASIWNQCLRFGSKIWRHPCLVFRQSNDRMVCFWIELLTCYVCLYFSYCLWCHCRNCITLAIQLVAGVFCIFFCRYIGDKLTGHVADRHIGRALDRSAVAFALDYWPSRRPNHISKFLSGDNEFNVDATLGYDFNDNLSACFQFVWFDGAGDQTGVDLEISCYFLLEA